MSCCNNNCNGKSSLYAYNTNVVNATCNQPLSFTESDVSGAYIEFDNDNSVITLKRGKYLINFNASACTTSSNGGTITVQGYCDNSPIKGAYSINASNYVGDIKNFAFSTVVNADGCIYKDVSKKIKIVNIGADSSFKGYAISITKL